MCSFLVATRRATSPARSSASTAGATPDTALTEHRSLVTRGYGAGHEMGDFRITSATFLRRYASPMARNRPTADAPATDRPGSWRELAVARSLDPARARAKEPVQRFLDAAARAHDAERRRQGLHCPGRGRALRPVAAQLLPVLRGQARAAAGAVRRVGPLHGRAPGSGSLDEVDDPLERLHRFVVEHSWCAGPTPRSGRRRRVGQRPPRWPSSASSC